MNNGNLYHGIGPPSAFLGQNNDFYLDMNNNFLYGPKMNNYWGTYMLLQGVQGIPGDPGPQGLRGLRGPIGGSCSESSDMLINNIYISNNLVVNSIYITNIDYVNNFIGNNVYVNMMNVSEDMTVDYIQVNNLTVIESITVESIYVNEITSTIVNVENINVNNLSTDQITSNNIIVHDLNISENFIVDNIEVYNLNVTESINVENINVDNINLSGDIRAQNININYLETNTITITESAIIENIYVDTINASSINDDEINITDTLTVNNNITVNELHITGTLDANTISSNNITATNINSNQIIVDDIVINTELTTNQLIINNDIYADDLIATESVTAEYFSVDPSVGDYIVYKTPIIDPPFITFPPFNAIAVSRNNAQVIFVVSSIMYYSLDFGKTYQSLPYYDTKYTDVAISADGRKIIVSSGFSNEITSYTLSILTYIPPNTIDLYTNGLLYKASHVDITPDGTGSITSYIREPPNECQAQIIYSSYDNLGNSTITPFTDNLGNEYEGKWTALACGASTVAFARKCLTTNLPSVLYRFYFDFYVIPNPELHESTFAIPTDEIISMAINVSGVSCQSIEQYILCLANYDMTNSRNRVYVIYNATSTYVELNPPLIFGFQGTSIEVNCDASLISVVGIYNSKPAICMRKGLDTIYTWNIEYIDNDATPPIIDITMASTFDLTRQIFVPTSTTIPITDPLLNLYYATYGYMSYFRDIVSCYASNIGSSSLTFATIFLDNNPIITSDGNKKKSISDNDLGLEFINKLRPVKYILKNSSDENKFNYGLIAQEVNDITEPDFAGYVNEDVNGETLHSLKYEEFIAPLIKANQELYEMIKSMNDILESLDNNNFY